MITRHIKHYFVVINNSRNKIVQILIYPFSILFTMLALIVKSDEPGLIFYGAIVVNVIYLAFALGLYWQDELHFTTYLLVSRMKPLRLAFTPTLAILFITTIYYMIFDIILIYRGYLIGPVYMSIPYLISILNIYLVNTYNLKIASKKVILKRETSFIKNIIFTILLTYFSMLVSITLLNIIFNY